MNKLLWFDLETTGLDAQRCAIVTGDFISETYGSVTELFHMECSPHEGAYISPEALTVQGITYDTLMRMPDPTQAYWLLCAFFKKHINQFDKTDKFMIAGYNPGFDVSFLSAFFKHMEDDYLGSFIDRRRVIDVRSIAVMCEELGLIPPLENYKLVTLAKHFEVEFKAHDSAEDIMVTRNIYRNHLLPLIMREMRKPKTKMHPFLHRIAILFGIR